MLFDKTRTIIPDTFLETDEDICHAVAAYCAQSNLNYAFEKRTYPLVAVIDGRRYEIVKYMTRKSLATYQVLRCREIE